MEFWGALQRSDSPAPGDLKQHSPGEECDSRGGHKGDEN